MPNEDTTPIPTPTTVVRPGPRTVAALVVAGALLIASTLLDLVAVALPNGPSGTRLSITAWSMDLGIGRSIQQYLGVVTLIVGAALIVVAAASLRSELTWTRNASLVAGGLGVGSGLYLASAGYSTGTFLTELAGASGGQINVTVGPGFVLALLGAAASLVAIAFPPRRDVVAGAVEDPADEVIVERLDDAEE